MTCSILVTGGAGFIGSHIVDALIEKGNQVTIYDNLEPQVHKARPNYINEKATFLEKDILEVETLKEAVADKEIIFHEASMVGVGQSMYQVERYMGVNTYGTARLLDLLVNTEHDVKKLVIASSMSNYGEGAYECPSCGVIYPEGRPVEQLQRREWEMRCHQCGEPARPIPTPESKPLNPTSVYAQTKRDQEEVSLLIGRTYGIPTVALRYFNVYGPRQSLNNPYTGVAAIFSSNIKCDNPPNIFEDGEQSRDFVSVHDIVQANIIVMESSNADYNVLNVGTGRATSILEISRLLQKLYHKEALEPVIIGKFRAGDIRDCYADISKIKGLGYEPKVDLEAGFKELVEWGEKEEASDSSEDVKEQLDRFKLVI